MNTHRATTGRLTGALQPRSAQQLSYVILNPRARGGATARLARPLQSLLSEAGHDNALLTPSSAEAACQLVNALPAGSRVIVAGGDGSVHTLLPTILAGGHSLAIIAAGSGNDTARAIGVHKLSLKAALNHAIHGTATLVDIGQADFIDAATGARQIVLFISSLSAGFDASISLRAREGPQWLSGMPRYLWATMAELRALRSWPMQVTADDTLIHNGAALFATTLNTRSFGGGMPAMPHASISDGKLNLLLAGNIKFREVLHLLPRLLTGMHLGQSKVRHQDFSQLHIQALEPVPLAADGEYLGAVTELKIQIRTACLPVVYRAG